MGRGPCQSRGVVEGEGGTESSTDAPICAPPLLLLCIDDKLSGKEQVGAGLGRLSIRALRWQHLLLTARPYRSLDVA